MSKHYVKFQPNQPEGYPAGKNIFYECLICTEELESKPVYFTECKCQNISVDNAGGRVSISYHEKFKIFKKT